MRFAWPASHQRVKPALMEINEKRKKKIKVITKWNAGKLQKQLLNCEGCLVTIWPSGVPFKR